MEPKLGWVWLSQTERRAAEAALDAHVAEGARDELGFGPIHFAFADKFFPGTSILHTSLRYAFFVPWAYQELLRAGLRGAFPSQALSKIEDRTGRQLMAFYGTSDGKGILGARVLRYDRSPVTKPSRIYWNALKTWGFVEDDERTGSPLNQTDVHHRWSDFVVPRKGPEVDATVSVHKLLSEMPPPPSEFSRPSEPLSFVLTEAEKAAVWSGWKSRTRVGEPSLMARLADRKKRAPQTLWGSEVRALCSPAEIASLERARQAASLVCIGRNLFNAMVQEMKSGPSKEIRRNLDDVLCEHHSQACALDIAALKRDDIPNLGKLSDFLRLIQKWASDGGDDYTAMTDHFRRRECQLKDERALLAQTSSVRREQWRYKISPPLTYRWPNVRRFLNELAGVHE